MPQSSAGRHVPTVARLPVKNLDGRFPKPSLQTGRPHSVFAANTGSGARPPRFPLWPCCSGPEALGE